MRAASGELEEPELGPVLDERGSDSSMLDNALELLVRGGRGVRHALSMLVPPAWQANRPRAGGARFFAPRRARRAVGRAGGGRLHGRARRRRGARPQRAAAAPLRRDRRRTRRVRVGGRSRAAARRRTRAARAARPRRDARGRRRPAAASSRTPRSSAGSRGAGRTRAGSPTRPSRARRRRAGAGAGGRPASAAGRRRLHARGPDAAAAAWPRRRPRAGLVDGRRHRAAAARGPRAPALDVLPPALRAGDEPADRPPARAGGDVAPDAARAARRRCSATGRAAARLVELESFFLFPSALAALAGLHPRHDARRGEGLGGVVRAARRGGRGGSARRGARCSCSSDGAWPTGARCRRRCSRSAAVQQRLVDAGLRTQDLARRRERRAARVAPLRVPARVRRRRDLPAARAGDGRGARGGRRARRRPARSRRGAAAVPRGDRERRAQGDGEDGDLRRRLVPRRAALRRARARAGGASTPASPARPRSGGVGFDQLEREVPRARRERRRSSRTRATSSSARAASRTRPAGRRRRAHALRHAVARRGPRRYARFASLVNERAPLELRDLLELVPAAEPVPLDEVEPAEAIVRRFSGGAMSHGSLSAEAHETIAIALNRLGARSNSGEGGEDPARFGTERTRGSSRSPRRGSA